MKARTVFVGKCMSKVYCNMARAQVLLNSLGATTGKNPQVRTAVHLYHDV